MRSFLKSVVSLVIILIFLLQSQVTVFAGEASNPLIVPQVVTGYKEPSDSFINILLLGIDFGTSGYWGSGFKKQIENCHTDAVMVVAVNLDQKRIDLISLPRDTVTYVPGVKGIYKLNAAANCAETLEEGLQRTKSAAEWLLGDIKIDYYFAVDMNTMIALGDAIGGVDFELEMSYRGHSQKWYNEGMQHLDGTGITDYLRARTNATVNYNDIGRTDRQREMIVAIFEKLRSDEDMLWNLFNTAMTMYDGFFTDITTAVIVQLAFMLPAILSVKEQDIGMQVLTGPYKGTLGWNFTFTDQENRLSVIKDVYDLTIEPIPYVSSEYAQWLLDTGFTTVHYVSVAQKLKETINTLDMENLTDEQKEAYSAFDYAYQATVASFETAADSMLAVDTQAMESARKVLREVADACAEAFSFSDRLSWSHNRNYWYDDPYINEYQLNWN